MPIDATYRIFYHTNGSHDLMLKNAVYRTGDDRFCLELSIIPSPIDAAYGVVLTHIGAAYDTNIISMEAAYKIISKSFDADLNTILMPIDTNRVISYRHRPMLPTISYQRPRILPYSSIIPMQVDAACTNILIRLDRWYVYVEYHINAAAYSSIILSPADTACSSVVIHQRQSIDTAAYSGIIIYQAPTETAYGYSTTSNPTKNARRTSTIVPSADLIPPAALSSYANADRCHLPCQMRPTAAVSSYQRQSITPTPIPSYRQKRLRNHSRTAPTFWRITFTWK